MTLNQIIDLLTKEQEQEQLFAQANGVRHRVLGNTLLGCIIEFSNYCRNHCMYCGIRCDNSELKRSRMKADTIIEKALNASKKGYKLIVLQSGEDMYFSKEIISYIIHEIKKFGVFLVLSLGERTYEEYAAWREAGADGYLMRIETADQVLYRRLHPGMSWERRLECLIALKELGYKLCSGTLVGLPGQTIESIANDIFFLNNIKADMVGIGPFIPHPATPLANEKGGDFYQTLRMMAIIRLIMENVPIIATTSMEALYPNGREKALNSGANVLLLSYTNTGIDYDLYPGMTKVV